VQFVALLEFSSGLCGGVLDQVSRLGRADRAATNSADLKKLLKFALREPCGPKARRECAPDFMRFQVSPLQCFTITVRPNILPSGTVILFRSTIGASGLCVCACR
jgi:hypothetical protein